MPLSTNENRLSIVREALRYWDPIGVIESREDGAAPADNEYDSYSFAVLRGLTDGRDAGYIARHLASVRAGAIGLGANAPTEVEQELAQKLVSWRDAGFRGKPDF